MSQTESAWIDELVAFATAVETIALEGWAGEAMRVARLNRPDGASLLRDGQVADDVGARFIVPAVHAHLEGGTAHPPPDWHMSLEATDPGAAAAVMASSIQRLAKDTAGVSAAHRAFARRAAGGIGALVADAPTFALVSNRSLSCCGSNVYVIERPTEWILVQLYAFC